LGSYGLRNAGIRNAAPKIHIVTAGKTVVFPAMVVHRQYLKPTLKAVFREIFLKREK